MKLASRGIVFSLTLLALTLVTPRARAQEGPLENTPPQGTTVEEIIQKFAAKEKEFKAARDQYT